MKLNFGKRLVLFVHWLMSLTFCALTVAMIIWPQCMETTRRLLDGTAKIAYAIALLVIYLLFAVGAVAIIFDKVKQDGDGDFIVVDSSETGRTRIAVSAVEQMIRQAVRGVSGIAEMKAAIRNETDSISIDVDAAIVNGTHVPTVTMNIQRAIRSYIELNCGVAVRGVSVSVHSLTDVEPTGRRGRRRASVNAEPVPAYTVPAVMPERREAAVEEPVKAVAEPEEPMFAEPEPAPAVEAEPEQAEPAPEAEAPQRKSFLKGLFGKRGAPKAEEETASEPATEEAAVEEAGDEPAPAAFEEPAPAAFEEPVSDAEPVFPEFTIGGDDDQDDDGEVEE